MWDILGIFMAGLCLACAQQGRGEPVFFEDLPPYLPRQNKDQKFALNSIPAQVNFGFAIRPTSTSVSAFVNQSPTSNTQTQYFNQGKSPQELSLDPSSASILPTRATIGFGFSNQISFQDNQPTFSSRPGAEVLQLESSSQQFGSTISNQNTVPINQKTIPTNQNTVPINQNTVLSNQNTVPINQNTVPINQNTVPTIQNTVLINQNTVPTNQNTVPINQNTIPTNQNTVPINQNTVPINQNTVPNNQNTVPINQNIIPTNQNTVPPIQQAFSNSIIDLQSGEPPSFQQITPFSQFVFTRSVSESSIVNPFLGQNGDFSQNSPPTTIATTPPDNVSFDLTNTLSIQIIPTQTISPTNEGVQTSLPSLDNSNGPVTFNPTGLISDGQDGSLISNQGIDPFSQASISSAPFTSTVPPLIQNLQPTLDVESTLFNNPVSGQVIQTPPPPVPSSNIVIDGTPQLPLQQPNLGNQPDDTRQQPVESLNQNIQADDAAGQEPNIVSPAAVVPLPVVPTGPQQQEILVNLNQLPTPTTSPAPFAQVPQPDLSSDDCLERVCDQIITGRDLTYERALEILQDEEYLDAADFDVVRRHRRFKRRSEEKKKPRVLSRKTRQVCGLFNSCTTAQTAQLSSASATTPFSTTCPSGSSCQRKRKKRQVCELVSSLPVTSANYCLVLGIAGGVASAAAIAVSARQNPPPPPPLAPIAPQPVVQPLQIVNAIDVFPELGLAPRGVPQPGQFGGGALPFVTDGASAEALGLVPSGLVPVAIFPPFQNARTRADAVGVIFSETDDQSITVAGFDPADQVDFLNRRQPRFKRGIVQSLRHSVMSGLDRLRHQVRRFWGIRQARRNGYYQQPATLLNQSNVRLNFIEVERRYGVRIRVRARRRCSSEEDCNSRCRDGISPVKCNVLTGLPLFNTNIYNSIARQTGEEFQSDAAPECRVELSDSCLQIRRRRRRL